MIHKALLLDLDGTLVRTDPIHRSLWTHILATYGINLTMEEYERRVAGKDDEAIWQEWMVGTQEERETWTTWKQEEFLRRIHEAVPVPGGKERIQEWNQTGLGYWTGVVTNSDAITASALLERLGIASLVDVLITADSGCDPKPSPAPYRMALSELGVDPENAVIVEDSEVGLLSARRTGPGQIFRIIPEHQPLSSEWGIIPIRDFTDNRLTSLLF